MINPIYRVCKRCVMDTSDPDITFNENGYCNHCTNAIQRIKEYEQNLKNPSSLINVINKIKKAGKGKKYDCIVGISGGLDSSFLLYRIIELGLRPLAVHIDNGWNSDFAVRNIENLVKGLNVDLYTIVLDWEEFKELQRAFLLSSVVDFELLSDNAIIMGLYRTMHKFSIVFSINGYNLSSESIMPGSWLYQPKYDGLNIKDIYRKHGRGKKIKSFPLATLFEFYSISKAFEKEINVPLLNYLSYNKDEAIKTLGKYGFTPYKYKHYESRITTFYQGYILPKKYNIDKRKAHLSSLICSGQIKRDEAFLQLQTQLYPEEKLTEEKDYFLKKLDFSEDDFNIIMNKPRLEHLAFNSYTKFFKRLSTIKGQLLR
jgi:N-acetyl sugar amidotransferase